MVTMNHHEDDKIAACILAGIDSFALPSATTRRI